MDNLGLEHNHSAGSMYCPICMPKDEPKSEFLESIHKFIDGPKLPFHLDRHPTLPGMWCVKRDVEGVLVMCADRFVGEEKAGFTIKEAECMRNELNQKFRDSGQ